MQKLTLVQPYQLTWHSLSSTMWILSVFSLGEVRGKNQYLFFSNMPQKFPSQQYVASLHFSSGNFCLPFSFGNPLLLPGVGQHCGQHMQLTICSIRTYTSPTDLPLEILKVSPSVMKQETNRVSNIKGRQLFQSTIISSLERNY